MIAINYYYYYYCEHLPRNTNIAATVDDIHPALP